MLVDQTNLKPATIQKCVQLVIKLQPIIEESPSAEWMDHCNQTGTFVICPKSSCRADAQAELAIGCIVAKDRRILEQNALLKQKSW